MHENLAPVSQTAATRELQTSGFTKTLLLSMTDFRMAGWLVRRLGSTALPPRSCTGYYSSKIQIGCDNHIETVRCAHIGCSLYNISSHDFYNGNVGIISRSWCQSCWHSLDFWIMRLASIGGVTWSTDAILLFFLQFRVGLDSCGFWPPKDANGCSYDAHHCRFVAGNLFVHLRLV